MMEQCQPESICCYSEHQQQQAMHPAPESHRVVGSDNNHDFRILLIDDNRDVIDSMGALLSLLEYDVRTAEDAESGLEIAQDFEPHLILSDIGLPGMDGYALAPELRKAAGARKLILAAATSYGLASDKRRAHDAGFDYHLVKPLDANLLISFVAMQQSEF